MKHTLKAKVEQSGMHSELYLLKLSNILTRKNLDKIAKESLEDFIKASPNTEIANGWSYDISFGTTKRSITFNNQTFRNGDNIAIIVDIGYGTVDGKWVNGSGYLKEPIKKVYYRINKLLEVV